MEEVRLPWIDSDDAEQEAQPPRPTRNRLDPTAHFADADATPTEEDMP